MDILAWGILVVVDVFVFAPMIGYSLLHGDSKSYTESMAIGTLAMVVVMMLFCALSAIIWALYQVMP